MHLPKITFKIEDRIYSFDATDGPKIRKVPPEDRQHLITLLSAIQKQEAISQQEVARLQAEKLNTLTEDQSKINSTSASVNPSVLVNKDVQANQNELPQTQGSISASKPIQKSVEGGEAAASLNSEQLAAARAEVMAIARAKPVKNPLKAKYDEDEKPADAGDALMARLVAEQKTDRSKQMTKGQYYLYGAMAGGFLLFIMAMLG